MYVIVIPNATNKKTQFKCKTFSQTTLRVINLLFTNKMSVYKLYINVSLHIHYVSVSFGLAESVLKIIRSIISPGFLRGNVFKTFNLKRCLF